MFYVYVYVYCLMPDGELTKKETGAIIILDTPLGRGGRGGNPMTEIPLNEDRKKALTQLKTARGQLDGIIRMIEDGRYCIDISNQIMAAQALLKKSQKHILIQHMEHCVLDAMNSDDPTLKREKTTEIALLMEKLLEAK